MLSVLGLSTILFSIHTPSLVISSCFMPLKSIYSHQRQSSIDPSCLTPSTSAQPAIRLPQHLADQEPWMLSFLLSLPSRPPVVCPSLTTASLAPATHPTMRYPHMSTTLSCSPRITITLIWKISISSPLYCGSQNPFSYMVPGWSWDIYIHINEWGWPVIFFSFYLCWVLISRLYIKWAKEWFLFVYVLEVFV